MAFPSIPAPSRTTYSVRRSRWLSRDDTALTENWLPFIHERTDPDPGTRARLPAGKEKTTPDQYLLILNALRNACNQKSSRHPMVDYRDGDIGHAVSELESMQLVREEWGHAHQITDTRPARC
jgi:hypothetical protein